MLVPALVGGCKMSGDRLAGEPMLEIKTGDCLDVLPILDAESVHMVVTDPPYFLDGLDNRWEKGVGGPRGTGAVGGLPVGMKFDRAQGKRLQAYMEPVAREIRRVLKPGGFVLALSSPRLYHRLAVALEDQDFEIRDQYVWHYTKKSQFKAFGMNYFISQKNNLTSMEKEKLRVALDGLKTPQLRPLFESILCAEKKKDGLILDNWIRHKTGLINSKESLHLGSPATVMDIEKPSRDNFNDHLTPKPVELFSHLIRLFTIEGQTVLDPFLGSGTAALAALSNNRNFIGIEINDDYVTIANKRIKAAGFDFLLR